MNDHDCDAPTRCGVASYSRVVQASSQRQQSLDLGTGTRNCTVKRTEVHC